MLLEECDSRQAKLDTDGSDRPRGFKTAALMDRAILLPLRALEFEYSGTRRGHGGRKSQNDLREAIAQDADCHS